MGKPKTWFVIHPEDSKEFETFFKETCGDDDGFYIIDKKDSIPIYLK